MKVYLDKDELYPAMRISMKPVHERDLPSEVPDELVAAFNAVHTRYMKLNAQLHEIYDQTYGGRR